MLDILASNYGESSCRSHDFRLVDESDLYMISVDCFDHYVEPRTQLLPVSVLPSVLRETAHKFKQTSDVTSDKSTTDSGFYSSITHAYRSQRIFSSVRTLQTKWLKIFPPGT